jgi:hypothetical protein
VPSEESVLELARSGLRAGRSARVAQLLRNRS